MLCSPRSGGDAFAVFARMCRESEIKGIRLGDDRLRSPETIAALFAEHGLDAVVDDAWLILDGDIDQVWSAAIAGAGGSVPFRLCARRITARDPAADTACRETRAAPAAGPRPSGGGPGSD